MFPIPSAPPHALSSSHCPLDPIAGPVRPSLFPWPLLRPIWPSLLLGPHLRCCPYLSITVWPHLRPWPALTVPSAPAGPPNSPIQRSPSLRAPSGHCMPSARPSPFLVVTPDSPFLPASARLTGHSLLLEQHHVVSRLGGCPLPARLPACFPAAALPVARPGPAACAPSSWSAPSAPLSLRSPRRLLPPWPRSLQRRCRRRPEVRFRSAARGRGVSAATRASHAAERADLSVEAGPSSARPLPSINGPRCQRPGWKWVPGLRGTRAVGGAKAGVPGSTLGVTCRQNRCPRWGGLRSRKRLYQKHIKNSPIYVIF